MKGIATGAPENSKHCDFCGFRLAAATVGIAINAKFGVVHSRIIASSHDSFNLDHRRIWIGPRAASKIKLKSRFFVLRGHDNFCYGTLSSQESSKSRKPKNKFYKLRRLLQFIVFIIYRPFIYVIHGIQIIVQITKIKVEYAKIRCVSFRTF